jgi:GH15 family glucan-1,4-alpha-glucosidase
MTPRRTRVSLQLAVLILCVGGVVSTAFAQARFDGCQPSQGGLTLSRNAQNWQFLDAVGPHSALFGREDGNFEAWIYPLKLLRDFHLTFHLGSHVIPAETLPRTITVRPESTSIRYVYDSFSVCETWFAPLHDTGAVVALQLESSEPVAIEASFTPDVAWMWPAGLGAGYSEWDSAYKVFNFGEEEHRFYAVAGSPEANAIRQAYSTNYSSAMIDGFQFGPAVKGSATYHFVLAASFKEKKAANDVYQKLLSQYPQLQQEAREYYEHYLDSTVSLSLPDRELQNAYDWSRISEVQGLVDDPFAGEGLIAGYDLSGANHRPGFSWFFGRDSMWTALALDSVGDFQTTRAALEFLAKYQGQDGRIPHEVPQTVSLVQWFKLYPYGFASADATPLYIIGTADYVRASGDPAFARAKWDSLWRAYQWLRSTYGANGFPKNQGVGHGWVEGGPLLPVSSELYQVGVAIQAQQSLADLAQLLHKPEADSLSHELPALKSRMETSFWSPDKNIYGYALDLEGKRIDRASVLGTVPMWFGLLDQQRGQQFLNVLSEPRHQADWGMRIIPEDDPLYDPTGYHFGSVWPLFTGWASVAEYRYHRPLQAYANLRANAQLVFDGSPGRATEVLSGHYYTPVATSSSHQIWSLAMIVSSLLRGMMGLSADALDSRVRFEPHVPANWTDFAIRNVPVGATSPTQTTNLTMSYHRSADEITLEVTRQGNRRVQLEFLPSFSLRAHVLGAEIDGKPAHFQTVEPANEADQHVAVLVPIANDRTIIRVRMKGDFGMVYPYVAPTMGAVSSNLKFVSEQWNATHDRLELQVAGAGGAKYRVPLAGDITGMTVSGAELSQDSLQIEFSPGPSDVYTTKVVVLQFPKP